MCANRDENITALQRCGKVARKVLRCAGGGQPPDRSAASKAGKRQLLLAKPASVIVIQCLAEYLKTELVCLFV